MNQPILAPTFLFRFSVPCLHLDRSSVARQIELPDAYRIPTFGELEGRPLFADLRMGWNAEGLELSLRVIGKTQPPWCRGVGIAENDGLSLWIATRDVHDIHRANRFCHRFTFFPQGGGRLGDLPLARLADIPRAQENPRWRASDSLPVRSQKRVDGYLLRAQIPASAMMGYDPDQLAQLGFSYAVFDRELGQQTFTVSSEFPFTLDPSLWGTLELKK